MRKRKASMRDVAELANVSVSAVSLVVRNKPGVADETRERVWEAIAQLGYVVAEPQDDGWDGGQEQGRIDGRRLTQLIAMKCSSRSTRRA